MIGDTLGLRAFRPGLGNEAYGQDCNEVIQIIFRDRALNGALALGLGASLLGLTGTVLPAAHAAPAPNPDGGPAAAAQRYPHADITFPGNDGKHHTVTWDKHSFKIDGKRLHIWSGEFHYWRLPDVQAWRDILQKMRANGYNAVSLYFFWGLHQQQDGGPFDFSKGTIKDVDLLLRIAAEEGLYVIARPGPYVNAEISMGGLPAYMTNYAAKLRSSDPKVLKASEDWLSAVNKIIKRHQVTDGGGSVLLYQVENELPNEKPVYANFLKKLVQHVKDDGITLPLFENDYGLGGRFRNVKEYGTSFYSYDRYPAGFNCSAPRNQIPDGEQQFRKYAPDTPHFITESQGGAFTPWGASFNASDCYKYTDEAFTRQWGVTNLANGVTAFNFYMGFGGTNWGWTGSPSSGFTSYDYGAGLTEDRLVTPKFGVQKEIGYYQDAIPQFASMDPVEAPPVKQVEGSSVRAYERQAQDRGSSATGAGTKVMAFRLSDSNDNTETSFAVPLVLDRARVEGGKLFSNDDRSPAIHYTGQWRQVADQEAANGTLSRSTTAGDKAVFTFTGTGVRVITGTGTANGSFTVQVDDGSPVSVTKASVDTEQNKPTQLEAFKIEGLAAGEHTVTVTNTGSGARKTLDLDAFDVLGGSPAPAGRVVNDTDADFWTWTGQWTPATGQAWTEGDLNKDEHYSNHAGNSVSFKFTGVGFDLIGPFSQNHGSATVTVDGKTVGKTTEKVVSPAEPQQTIFTWRAEAGAAPSEHTVTVTVDGTSFPNSSGTYVAIDGVRLFENAAQLPSDTFVKPGQLGWERIPQQADTKLHLHGRDALLVTADAKIAGHDLYYTTSQPFGHWFATGAGDMQYLVGHRGDPGETVLHYTSEPSVTLPEGVTKHWDARTGQLRLNYTHTQKPFTIAVKAGDKTLLLRVIDRQMAVKTWLLQGNTDAGLATTAVEGAELGRTVKYEGGQAALTGSVPAATTLTVFPPASARSVTWNGAPLGNVSAGQAVGQVKGPKAVQPHTLKFVRMSDDAEARADYDDSAWKVASDITAANPVQQLGPQGRNRAGVVLDSNHYGMYEGSVWYRASYTSAQDDPQITLNGNAGSGQPRQGKTPGFMQVWANGHYAGALPADGHDHTLRLPTGVVQRDQPVKLAVLVHNLGQNLDWSDNGLSKQNRGLRDAVLQNEGPVVWKIRGATVEDAKSAQRNPSGTLYNNGGLGGELAGWHMPKFDDSSWEKAANLHSPAGVTWYRAHLPLDLPKGQETAFRLEIDSQRFNQPTHADAAQVTLFVNGWNTGVYIGDIGPQNSFTIPSAFLNPNGDNVITAVVAAKSDGMGPEAIRLVPLHTSTLPLPVKSPKPGETPAVTPSGTPSPSHTQGNTDESADSNGSTGHHSGGTDASKDSARHHSGGSANAGKSTGQRSVADAAQGGSDSPLASTGVGVTAAGLVVLLLILAGLAVRQMRRRN